MEMEFQSLSCLLDISFRKTFRQRSVRTAQKLFAVHSFDNLSAHLRDILIHDLIECFIVRDHAEIPVRLDQKIVDRLVPADTLLLRLSILQVFQLCHHFFALLRGCLTDPALKRSPFQGGPEFRDLIHIDLF